MIQHIPAASRHLSFHGWLKSFYLFSFADYYDAANTHFGTLRVFNDDWIDAESGFGDHAHQNMEIVTIVLSGTLTHKDSMGNQATIRAGEVQRMSAGRVVVHSELNLSNEPVSLYQIWIEPHTFDLAPSYEQKDFSKTSNTNQLLPLVAGSPTGEALSMSTDATIFSSHLEEGNTVTHDVAAGRGVFVYTRSGQLNVNGTMLLPFDQARISSESVVTFVAKEATDFIVIDVPLGNQQRDEKAA